MCCSQLYVIERSHSDLFAHFVLIYSFRKQVGAPVRIVREARPLGVAYTHNLNLKQKELVNVNAKIEQPNKPLQEIPMQVIQNREQFEEQGPVVINTDQVAPPKPKNS